MKISFRASGQVAVETKSGFVDRHVHSPPMFLKFNFAFAFFIGGDSKGSSHFMQKPT